ncbi:MAG: FAD-dependent oxidoreductase [Planctomycetota bacterium]
MRALVSPLLTVAITLVACPTEAELLWLEAERFHKLGGWTNDAQFIDQMGSPYLMAIGLGAPVRNAGTSVKVPGAGRYRVWVRAKDWVPEYHPGRFQLLIQGQPLKKTFGASGKTGWHWEDGGVHQLSGEIELQLRDLTGYYARCDTIVLSDDLDWEPPVEVREIARLRAKFGGVSPKTDVMPRSDVVVIGGGLAGATAAVAAARNGCQTTLIQNRPVLGGNASGDILVPPVGAWPGAYRSRYPLSPRETGIVEEYRTAGNQRIKEGRLYANRLLRLVELEPNLDLHLNTHATGARMQEGSGQRIAAVDAVEVRTGRRLRFPARVFIDCTGDSVIGVAAEAEYRHGKEPKSMYNEPWAPEEPSDNTMGNGLKYFARDMGEPRPFTTPPWIFSFETCDSIGPERHPKLTTSIEIGWQWKIELGGLRDTYADAEEIRDDLLRLIYGLWDHTKNHCPEQRKRAVNHELVWVGYVAGKRENRRLIGDYVLTQNDIADQKCFPDRVAFGAWSVDDHYSAGFFHDGPTARHLDHAEHHHKGVPFTIPFRSLYSRNVDNLLMAGRNISASHLAMSNTRVMLTCAILGHAAGTGAAFCVHENTSPRGVYRNHLSELQQKLLKEGAPVLHLKANDPRDLAAKTAVTASSHRVHSSGDKMVPENVVNGFARSTGSRGEETTNAWGPDPGSKGPHWVELSWPQPVRFNMVHVTFQTADLAPRQFAVEARRRGKWTPIAEVELNRHRRHVLGLENPVSTDALRLVENEPAGVCEIRVYQEPERLVKIAKRAHANMRLPDRGPWLPWGDRESLISGLDPDQLDGIVLDDTVAERIGHWNHSTWSDHYVGAGYVHDNNEWKGEKLLRFRPRVEQAGRYEVRLAFTAFTNRASNVPVSVKTPRKKKTMRIDQRKTPPIDDLFLSLGSFELSPNDNPVIEISNAGTDGYVVVDCLQIIPER